MRGLKNCVFSPCVTVAMLYWEFSFSKAWFQSLDENPHLWWLSLLCSFAWQEHSFTTGVVPCHFAILHQVSHTLSQSFKVELEFCVYQDLTESLILTFSLLPILLKKLVSCFVLDWKQSKFAWYHIQIEYLAEFLHEIPCVRYSHLRDYFWS